MILQADAATTLDWTGCYPSNWRGLISPESFAHPAKFSSKLIRRILEHGQVRGWRKRGDLIGDPFGGIGCGGVMAARHGLRWIGMEREAEALQATLCRMRRPDSVLGEPVGSKNSIRRRSGGNQIGT